jgi:hypothetical protein
MPSKKGATIPLKSGNRSMANIVVIPAQAGIQYFTGFLDARVRGHDNVRLMQAILCQKCIRPLLRVLYCTL